MVVGVAKSYGLRLSASAVVMFVASGVKVVIGRNAVYWTPGSAGVWLRGVLRVDRRVSSSTRMGWGRVVVGAGW